jgi:hypothetical protein
MSLVGRRFSPREKEAGVAAVYNCNLRAWINAPRGTLDRCGLARAACGRLEAAAEPALGFRSDFSARILDYFAQLNRRSDARA